MNDTDGEMILRLFGLLLILAVPVVIVGAALKYLLF
jgi:hypothetical protein